MDKKLTITQKKYTGDTTVISARVPKDLVEKIDGVALASGRNRNEILQMCLEFAVENLTIEK